MDLKITKSFSYLDQKYHLIIVNDKIKEDYFINYVKNYEGNQIVIDCEFNPGLEIALIQINFESEKKEKEIFFISPRVNNKKIVESFKNLLINIKIIKILHGSVGIDLPYFFKEILLDKKDKINFISSLIDTKFLCEYYNIINHLDRKCKINYFLKDHKILDEELFNKIIQNEEKQGPIYLLKHNINKLTKEMIDYSAYDCIFLGHLVNKFDNETKNIVIPIFRLILMIKMNLFFDFELENNKLNKLNLLNINNITFIEIYNYQEGYLSQVFENLLKITWFKSTLIFIIKNFLYLEIKNHFNLNFFIQYLSFPKLPILSQLKKEIKLFIHNI